MGRKVRFTKRPVEQEVIVAAGRYEFHQLPEPFRKNTVTMYADEADHNMGGGGGTARSVDELLQALGDRVGIPVVNETQPVEATRISYTHYRSSYLARITDPVEKARKLGTLLQNASAQTGFQFSIERRTMEKWFLTEEGP